MSYQTNNSDGWWTKLSASAVARSRNIWRKLYVIYMRTLCLHTSNVMNAHPVDIAEVIMGLPEREYVPSLEPEPEPEPEPCCGFCGVTASPINKLIMSNMSEQCICERCVRCLSEQVYRMDFLDAAAVTSEYMH